MTSSQTNPSPPEDALDLLRGRVRELSNRYKHGDISAFVQLVRLLLSETVAARGAEARVHATYTTTDRSTAYIGGPETKDLIQLRDRRWLRLIVSVYLEDTPKGPHLKVASSSYQYQARGDQDSWVFRYDYLRKSPTREPGAHLQIHGSLQEGGVLPADEALASVQFPTRRVSLEAVIRLLAMEFHVPCKEGPEWMNAALLEAEQAFLEIAHEPEPALFGPAD